VPEQSCWYRLTALEDGGRRVIAGPLEVAVLDVQGRTVARLASGDWSAGRHAIEWNGEGTRGRLPPGLYLIRYRFPGGQAFRSIVMSR